MDVNIGYYKQALRPIFITTFLGRGRCSTVSGSDGSSSVIMIPKKGESNTFYLPSYLGFQIEHKSSTSILLSK